MGFVYGALSLVFTWLRSAMPWLLGAVGASFSNWIVSAGFGVVVFSGFNILTSRLIGTAVNSLNGLGDIGGFGADIVMLLGYMWLDKALNLVISTGAFLMAIKGVRQGIAMRQAWWKPGQKTGGMEG
ncbi:DUF2523 domain-containing protein [Vibrio clamense]|uniref:DUF2523 family protein n=1 Tax=Vibrio TaxID=662 RepID=UPI0014937FF5|nr:MULTISPECIES: DUF2523 family protein [Vibrio]MDN3699252.1 DUF2523 family protein [Vibrio cortegadensis]NOH83719.1 DUF2523 domain-containing protein [Vibrio sp. 03-59-1]